MHVLCTGNNCVTKDNFPLTVLKWTTKVFYSLFILGCDRNTILLITCPLFACLRAGFHAFVHVWPNGRNQRKHQLI